MATGRTSRLIAFYLPQFHPIPENDEWWGKGFTEWTNVVGARPLFAGHYQPHLPADLGLYDLRVPEVREAQADLAREYGIHGFCYYHYWFHGKRLLGRPLDEVLASGRPDFPFCICWANESWTRRWEHDDPAVLIAQRYSHEDDIEHMRFLIPILNDPRYIRVNGKPLLAVYRVNLMPDPQATARLWRQEARRAGLPGLYLCTVISLPELHFDPAAIGFDAAIEFHPDWAHLSPQIRPRDLGLGQRLAKHTVFQRRGVRRIPRWITKWEERLLPEEPSHVLNVHRVRSYGATAQRTMERPEPDYRVIPGVMSGWDNSPRRREGANIFIDNTPDLFERWLRSAIAQACKRFQDEERLVFINAWNEWGEGAHLEPDQRWGHAYLAAVKRAQLTADDPGTRVGGDVPTMPFYEKMLSP